MTQYDKQRLKLQEAMDAELNQLDATQVVGSDYWAAVKAVHEKYKTLLQEVDDAERQRDALMRAKETSLNKERPEQTYADIAGQLKANKISELIAQLASLSSHSVDSSIAAEVAITDPFYSDKKDPLAVFNRWWDSELQKLPSIQDLVDFLNRISINEKGYIVYNRASDVESIDSTSILNADVLKSPKQRRQERYEAERRKRRLRSPLLIRSDADFKAKKQQQRKIAQHESALNAFTSIINAYGLPESLCDLLIEHADSVCIPKGLLHVDDYQQMLEQFLRYCPNPAERVKVVKQSIQRNWRVLSNGKI